MNFEEFQQEFKKQLPIKIQYYINLFLDKCINEDTVTEFLSDNSFCTFGGGGWACPICSHGCFKINVMWALESLEKKNKLNFKLDDFQSLEMELSCNHMKENQE